MAEYNSPEDIDALSPFEARRRAREGGLNLNQATRDLLMKRAVPPNPPDHNSKEEIALLTPLQAQHRLGRESGPNLDPDAAELLEKRAAVAERGGDYPENSPEDILNLTPDEARLRLREDADGELHPVVRAALRRRATEKDLHFSRDQYRPDHMTGLQFAAGDDLVPAMFYRPTTLTVEGHQRVFFGVGTQPVPKRMVTPQLDASLAAHDVLLPDDIKPRKKAAKKKGDKEEADPDKED